MTSARTRRPHRHTPAIACEITHETWGPHPGCAEFMTRPEVWICRTPATHLAVLAEDPTDPYFDPSTPPARLRVCADHAKMADELALTRVYPFRRTSS